MTLVANPCHTFLLTPPVLLAIGNGPSSIKPIEEIIGMLMTHASSRIPAMVPPSEQCELGITKTTSTAHFPRWQVFGHFQKVKDAPLVRRYFSDDNTMLVIASAMDLAVDECEPA